MSSDMATRRGFIVGFVLEYTLLPYEKKDTDVFLQICLKWRVT